MKPSIRLVLCATLACLPVAAADAESERLSVMSDGRTVGHLNVDTQGSSSVIDFAYKDNGRGPTIREAVDLDVDGLPVRWTINGAITFGSVIAEDFERTHGSASWTDSTGHGKAKIRSPSIYVSQNGSPWALGVYARALLKHGNAMPALPGGTLRLTTGASLTVKGGPGAIDVTAYTLGGIETKPETVLLDGRNQLFAYVTPDFLVVRAGYEAEERRLRTLAATWSAERYASIQKSCAHDYGVPVRIRNVRIFQPTTGTLSGPVAVLVSGRTIAAIEPSDSPPTPGEVSVDGAGGTLVAGMTEMHGHLNQDNAMLNLIAGITSVRDMGNDNAVLDRLIHRIDDGTVAGPRVIRSGFIEGKSPFSASNGILVDSEKAAVDAVRWYAARGFWQIKIYNSVDPSWVPAMAAEAHRLGMRVAGHVPAFATADQMIVDGYDEITHMNQFMLGWVIKPTEDTRTLFRLTALKRLPALDLNSAPVQQTVRMMVDGGKAIDPTVGIHEHLLLDRDGQVPPGAVDYFDHMPVGEQRDLRQALIDTSAPGDDAAYRAAYAKILATVRLLHDRGVFIVPGTDTGGSFTYHRELELYVQAGFSNAEVLTRATFDVAKYLGQDQERGSIAKGKLADFFLIPGDPTKDVKAIKTIEMVVKDGVFYYPSEVYPRFGIRPFAPAPRIELSGDHR